MRVNQNKMGRCRKCGKWIFSGPNTVWDIKTNKWYHKKCHNKVEQKKK